jgi:hypothetical protein
LPRSVIAEAVIRAFEPAIVKQLALGEWEALVTAAIVEGDHLAIVRAPHDDWLAGDLEALELMEGKFPREADGIPAILHVLELAHFSCLHVF